MKRYENRGREFESNWGGGEVYKKRERDLLFRNRDIFSERKRERVKERE